MAAITWKSATSGDFNTGTNWNGNVVPGAGDDAEILATGTPYTVTASQANTVSDIQTSASATLQINNNVRDFVATNGTGSGANAGAIDVGNDAYFDLGGTVDNSGSINLQSGGNDTRLRLLSSTTLSGGGAITLSNNANNSIDETVTGLTLTNTNNTIEGAGNIGLGENLGFTNQSGGTLNADTSNTLILQTSGAVANAGRFEATASGGLNLVGTTVNNAGGTIEANGGNVSLVGADIQGGTLSTPSGVIQTGANDRGSMLDGSTAAGQINNQGAFDITNDAYLTIAGTINNTGSINVQSAGNDTRLRIAAAGATLSGGGTVVLTNNSNNTIDLAGAAATLTNTNNTIEGSGNIGNGGALGLSNQAGGIVNANQSNTLFIDTTGAVSNASILEASPGGTLQIQSTKISNTTAGKIETNGGGTVNLASADIVGGTLSDVSGGTIQVVDRGSTLDGTIGTNKILLLGSLNILNNDYLTIDGTINLSQKIGKVTTTGTIDLSSGGNDTRLIVGVKNATLGKGGFVAMTDNANNSITGTLTVTGTAPHQKFKISTLTNDATISGAGTIGSEMLLKNAGTIDATGGNALIIQTGDSRVAKSNIVSNTGLIEATNPNALGATGGLRIVDTIVNGIKSTVEANGATTHVDLEGATIQGGKLVTANGGVIETFANDRTSTLDGSSTAGAVNNQATVDVTNNAYLTINGAINNTGSINLQSVGNDTRLRTGAAGVTLTGGGTVTLSNNVNNTIDGSGALTNTNNTIEGGGNIGNGEAFSFTNQALGIVDANQTNGLTLDTTTAVTNAGLIETTASGGLNILSTTVSNGTAGVIEANGGNVSLQSADIQGGTLKSPSGVITTAPNDRGSLLDGTTNTVNNQATVDITNNAWLTINGAIDNTGSINLQSVGNDTRLRTGAAGVTLTGGGTITFSNNVNNSIDGSGTLTNTNNTIEGGGNIGNGAAFGFVNQASGIVDADTASTLTLNTTTAITNAGLIETTASGGLNILSTTVSNGTAGTIKANGGNVTLTSADIQGGTLSSPSGVFTTAVNNRGSVLDGSTNTVNNQATVDITNNAYLTINGAINNTGTINIQSAGNDTELVIGSAGATLTGGGSIVLSANANNAISGSVNGVTLTNTDNTIEGVGGIGSGQLNLSNGASGIVEAAGGSLTINTNTLTNNGTLEANSGSSLFVVNGVTGTGSASIGDGGRIDFEGAFGQNVTFTGALSTSHGELDLAQTLGTDYTGTVAGLQAGDSNEFMVLNDLSFVSGQTSASFNQSTNMLTVTNGTNSSQIHVLGTFAANAFSTSNNGGHVEVFDPASSGSQPLIAAAPAAQHSA